MVDLTLATVVDDSNEAIAKRRAQLPRVEAPQPYSTLMALPLMDGRIEWETVKGMFGTMSRYWTGCLDKCYTSNIGLARNELVNGFLRTPFEWLVMLDGDIVFSAQDLAFLLDGNDYAVNAPYAQKDANARPVTQGLGFTRVHRCVFDMLRSEQLCVPFTFKDMAMHDFFIQGATGHGGYLGEDQGFWYLLGLIGVKPRIEHRCRLQHIGKFRYVSEDANSATH